VAIQSETHVQQKADISLVRKFVRYDSFINGNQAVAPRKGETIQILAERISRVLGLKEVSINSIPIQTAALMADIAEKHLCRFQCNLQLICTRNSWGGNYNPITGRVNIGCNMSLEETVATFIHEYAHAVHYAALASPDSKERFTKELRLIRKENLDCLKSIFKRAAAHVPSLADLIERPNRSGSDLIHSMIRRMEENFDEIPITILAEFSRNLASQYALKNNTEYFSECFTDYLLNQEPSPFTQRIWQLAVNMAHDAHVKTAPATTWLDHAEFYCRQGLLITAPCDTIAWVCDSNWNFILPGIQDVQMHCRLQAHIHGSQPLKKHTLPRPHIFDVPPEFGLSFKKLLLIPKYYNFYYYALDAAIKHGTTSLVLPLFLDSQENSFKQLVNDINEIDQLLKSASLPLRRITFVTPSRSLAVHLKTFLPVTLERILLDNVVLEGPVRLSQVTFSMRPTIYLNTRLPIEKKPVIPQFIEWLACVGVSLSTDQPLTTDAEAMVVYTSEHSNLFPKQISSVKNPVFQHLMPKQIGCVPDPVLLQLESIVEQEKRRLYRMAAGNVLVVNVSQEFELKARYLILVPRSQQFRHQMLLAAVRIADALKVTELAVPYYMYAHAGKVAADTVDDLRFVDKDFGCKPDVLRKIIFCAQSRKDYAPFVP
jgi:hypothetical protein